MSVQLIAFVALLGVNLPTGSAPEPVPFPHFPDTLHTVVWRNWSLVPMERLAKAVDASPEQLIALGKSMGLPDPPTIDAEQEARSYISVIRRNWHLLPYDQLLILLDWEAEKLDFVLREDDFLFIKFGSLKPKCPPVKYAPPSKADEVVAGRIAKWVADAFPGGIDAAEEPLFGFVKNLSAPFKNTKELPKNQRFSPRYCAPYFGLYGDPLENSDIDPFPPAYLERVKASGVGGIWMPVLLYQLAPFPWDPEKSEGYEERLAYLNDLVNRVKGSGVDIYLYLNEPRSLPHVFFEERPALKGVSSGEVSALCSSLPEVQGWLRDSVTTLCKAVPNLGGIFTISASENLTNCWSKGSAAACPRCKERAPDAVIAEVSTIIWDGIQAAESKAEYIAWDWGWRNEWAPKVIEKLPLGVALQSVSEWDMMVTRGGIETRVGEYSLSAVGPGPRATAHWKVARDRGMKTVAKIQANNTWELSSVPYVPAVANAAKHAQNLRAAGVEGIMLGWTLGGHPSPNLEVFSAMGADDSVTPEVAMLQVAKERFGDALAPKAVSFWQEVSAAFSEYPYHIGVMYNGPQQVGPSNLLWSESTGYRSTMVCFPYDSLKTWRAGFPPKVFRGQFEKMAVGFTKAADKLEALDARSLDAQQQANLEQEIRITRACAIHFESVANQTGFIVARDALAAAEGDARTTLARELEALLKRELELAQKLHAIQSVDSRIGFEASNHYFYIPNDLVEKIINCQHLLAEWIPTLN
jgi:hypothetical protein